MGRIAAGRALALDCELRLSGQTSRALTRSQAPRGAVGASDRAGSPREFVITWRTRRSRVPQRPQVVLDLVWRKLADGPTTGNLSGAGLASPPPLSWYSASSLQADLRDGLSAGDGRSAVASIQGVYPSPGGSGERDGTGLRWRRWRPRRLGGRPFACAVGLRGAVGMG